MASLDTLRTHLRGVTAFPITPFHANLDLNLDGLRHNVDWMIRHGIVTLVAAGGTGELYSLTTEETEAVHRTVIEAAAGRAAVICGVGGKQRESQQLAATAEKAGASGILMLPPAYGPSPEDGLLAFYAGIAQSVHIGVLPYARDWACSIARTSEPNHEAHSRHHRRRRGGHCRGSACSGSGLEPDPH